MTAFVDKILEYLATAGVRILCGVVILVVGWILINKFIKAFDKFKRLQKLEKTVRTFFKSALNIALKTLLVVVAASILGVPMTSFVAILSTIGLTIGLALQGGLSNIAGGIILLIVKPFKIGDFIETDSACGTVLEVNIFYTVLVTADGKRVDVPNGIVTNNKLTNFSTEPYRRIDFSIVVPYGTNMDKVSEIITDMVRSNSLVYIDDTHVPMAKVGGYEEDGLKVDIRAWTENANYWPAFYALNEGTREVLSANNIKLSNRQINIRLEK